MVSVFVTHSPHFFSRDRSALHYPYVLAFEPTFVEIRHVETSLISQIIQGNNLQCLFADTPPSTTNSSQSQYYNPYQQQSYGYAQQSTPSLNGYNGRPSIQNGYSPSYPQSYPARGPSSGRDEILIASDDRIMRVQLCLRHRDQ